MVDPRIEKLMNDPRGRELLEEFVESAQAANKMDSMSDLEVAELLNIYLDDLNIASIQFALISQAIDRLRRSNLGQLTKPENL